MKKKFPQLFRSATRPRSASFTLPTLGWGLPTLRSKNQTLLEGRIRG